MKKDFCLMKVGFVRMFSELVIVMSTSLCIEKCRNNNNFKKHIYIGDILTKPLFERSV